MADRMAGRVLNGRYELQSVLGGGGMALVYRARDTVLNRTVAIKVLREQYASDPLFQQRFTREAQSAGALSHPNIVSVYDVGKDGDLPYIVMEYVPGLTLRDLIARDHELPVDQAVNIAAGILSAVEYAHRNGLIHRDIKPGNVLITPQGTVKVVDFGIAKGASDLSLTAAGMALGTAAYFSPEQARGEPARVQSDLYSVGVTLYEMLTGRTPFESDTDVGMAFKHINEAPIPPRRLNPLIPPQLEAIVLRALAKNPAARYGAAAEMERALRNYAAFGTQPTAALPPPVIRPAPAPRAVPPPRPVPVQVTPYRSGNSSLLTWVLGLVALLLLLGGAVAVLNGGSGLSPGTPTPVFGTDPTFIPPTLNRVVPPTATVPQVPTDTALPSATLPPSATALPSATPAPSATAVPLVAAPDLTNHTLPDAQAVATALGLTVVVASQKNDATHPAGTIISQDPVPGTQVTAGSTIGVVLSKGPAVVAMPNVINTDGKQAQDYLARLGFQVTVQSERSASVPVGVVTRQQPDPGQPVTAGAAVTIWISIGDLVTVPDVVGQDEKPALATLTAAGLTAQVVHIKPNQLPGLPKVGKGQVARTDPAAGTEVPRGSTVTVIVVTE